MSFVSNLKITLHKPNLLVGICGVFVLLGVARNLPLSERFFTLQALLESLARLLLGVGVILVSVWNGSPLAFAILLLIPGITLGLALQYSLKEKRREGLLLLIPFMLNMICGAYFALFTLPGQNYTCEFPISADHFMRVTAYGQSDSSTVFFSATTNSGQDWSQLADFSFDGKYIPECKNKRSLDKGFIWVWENWKLLLTYDGGNTWEVKSLNGEALPIFNGLYLSKIIDIRFKTLKTGEMTLETDQGSLIKIQTEDSGTTWHIILSLTDLQAAALNA